MTQAIREATAEDLPVICVLGQEVNLLHHEAWPQVFAAPSDPSRDAPHWQQSIASPNATTFLAEHSEQVIAFITVFFVTDSSPLLQPTPFARIGSICVAAQVRGRGIGRALMAQAERWAFERGATDLRLNVWAFNQAALRFYEELGYEVRLHSLGKALSRAA
jgi:ribosomal protein S18 acetylase RimI-like enzyme